MTYHAGRETPPLSLYSSTEVPCLSSSQDQNIHNGAPKSIQGHKLNAALILKMEVAHYNNNLQRNLSDEIAWILSDKLPGKLFCVFSSLKTSGSGLY